ncbi:MAG: Flp family type IVb pilin [Acidobacteria bacterium]|nr:Flp family type IVb pilin [Acidobacteriota bacterium]
MTVVTCLRAFTRDETAQDLLEYALLVTLIALVVVGALTVTGTNVSAVFTDIANKIIPAA